MSFSMTGRVAGEGYAEYRKRAADRLHDLMTAPKSKGCEWVSKPMAVGVGVFLIEPTGDEYLMAYVSNGK